MSHQLRPEIIEAPNLAQLADKFIIFIARWVQNIRRGEELVIPVDRSKELPICRALNKERLELMLLDEATSATRCRNLEVCPGRSGRACSKNTYCCSHRPYQTYRNAHQRSQFRISEESDDLVRATPYGKESQDPAKLGILVENIILMVLCPQ
uniref:Uncharacterized protein n=1 Tax=Populus alba TaxID=43335 RepID=A0A4U5MBV1_POPAL|nr:hypothetical protein D5086_0000317620 [Populus alba]